ncbi:MAG: hypothetical protein ACLRMZ_18640 [Blautia marasmi]
METKEEFETVMQASPDYIQGFLFGRPVSAGEFEKLYFSEEGGTVLSLPHKTAE